MPQRILLVILTACMTLSAQTDQLTEAIALMQRGDLRSAEELLKNQRNNAAALEVLGVVLDQEKKFEEAENAYRSSLRIDPREPSLLNNYGNHLLMVGHTEAARQMFVRAVTLDPSNKNANVQLAKLAIEAKRGGSALNFLAHLSNSDRETPDIDLLFGMAFSSVRHYAEAEEHLRRVTEVQPENFQAQYALGLAASKANHNEQARQSLGRALELKPENADVLYDLAVVNLQADRGLEAVALLARGSSSAPERADIQLLLAQTTARLGYFEDSIRAWDRYLGLKPGDDTARRERAFAETAISQNPEAGIADLTAFTKKYPKEALGHYEAGTALSVSEPARAAGELSQAIQLNPKLTAAYVARGLLFYRQGKNDAALLDFIAAAKQQPENARVLDRLGETYLAAGHVDRALPVLKKAAEIAPQDPSVLLHLGRALTKSGQQTAAAEVFARYRKLDSVPANTSHGAGLVDFLSLSPGEQQARYRAGVERTVAALPGNVEAQVKYLELLLLDGQREQSRETCRTLIELRPSGELLAEAGRALLEAGDYATAADFLEKGMRSADSQLPLLQLELAQARFYTAGPEAGLAEMNRIDQSARTAGYYTARAEMLGTLGRASGFSPQQEQ